MRRFALAALAAAVALPAIAVTAATPSKEIAAAVADPARSEADRARDKYRHPAETLTFFGVKPTQTVVEFLPSGGWYTQILAPLTGEKGRYVGLLSPAPRGQESFAKMQAAGGARLAKATTATVDFATGASTVPPGSADVVLTFRNVHNLLMMGDTQAPTVFKAFYAMLKPGGTLGVVDHRLPEARDVAAEKKSGYVKRSTILKLATDAGFKLAGESEVNANPKDKADYPGGVWTLPPMYALKDVDRAKYAAIGESDRLTMKFVKPK